MTIPIPRFTKFNRQSPWLRTLMPVLVGVASILGCAIPSQQRNGSSVADQVLVPTGYVGYIRIDYNVPKAPPLPVKQGALIHTIPGSGYLKTATAPREGWHREEFYYVGGKTKTLLQDDNSSTSLVWDDGLGAQGESQSSQVERTFFIGSKRYYDLTSKAGGYVGPLNLTMLNARLKGKNLSYQTFDKRNFSKQNLAGANLDASLFQRANLSGANLQYAYMAPEMSHADLRNADLRGAEFFDCICVGVDLRGADLRGARLQNVDLRQAMLMGAKFQGLMYDASTQWPKRFNPKARGAVMVPARPRIS